MAKVTFGVATSGELPESVVEGRWLMVPQGDGKGKLYLDYNNEHHLIVGEGIITLPYGGSKEWLEANGDTSLLYQIDGYVWAFIDDTGWVRSSTQFHIVSDESEMDNVDDSICLLRSGNIGTVYSYSEASGDVGVPIYDNLPETANDGDIVAVGGKKYKATVTTEDVPKYTNQIPVSIDADGNVYNNTGYKEAYRINSSGAEDTFTTVPAFITGYIPIKSGDIIRVNGNYFSTTHANKGSLNMCIYDSTFTNIVVANMGNAFAGTGMFKDIVTNDDGFVVQATLNGSWSYLSGKDVAYVRFSMLGTGESAVVTVNEEIIDETVTKITWSDIGEYVAPTEEGWNATDEIYEIIDSLSTTTDNGAVAVYSADGYLYSYLTGASWVRTSKYSTPTLSIDGELSETSTNAIQNKVVKQTFDGVDEKIESNTAEINEINLKIADIVGGNEVIIVPEFWKEAVDALSDTIKGLQNSSGVNAFQFLWFSDLHGTNGYTNTNGAGTSVVGNIGYVAQYVVDKYDIPFVAISGDIHSQASYTEESRVWTEYENIRTLLSPIDKAKLIYTKGNHDGAWGSPVDGVYYLNNIGGKKIYNALFRKQSTDRTRVFGGDGSYFYVDSPQKIRFIMLNCQTDGDGSVDTNGCAVYNSMKNSVYGTEQLEWVSNIALDVPEGWKVVFMTHQHPNTSADGSLLAGIINAYINRTSYTGNKNVSGSYWGNGVSDTTYTQVSVSADFSDAVGNVVCLFHGHIHKDNIDTSTYLFPCISITTAGADVRDTNPVERVGGTATETVMDIVTITEDTIYMTRLGAGADRVVYYNNDSVSQ